MATQTPFDNFLGLYQGRMVPQLTQAANGSYVWVLGFDLTTQKEYFAFGDYVEVASHLDLTGISFLTAQVWVKQPITLDRRDITTGFEILGATSSTISAVAGAAGPDSSCVITTSQPHHLVENDIINIRGAGGSLNINGRWTVGLVTSANAIVGPLDTPSATKFYIKHFSGSGTYTSGGSLGLQERFYLASGFTEAEVGRVVQVSGSTTSTNNGNYRILGLQAQPGVSPAKLAWVERPSATALIYDSRTSNASLQALGQGTRWKVSLMVEDSGGLKERARVVQKSTQTGFFRTDLKANVRQHAGDRAFTVRLTLVPASNNDLYSLPAAP